MYSGIGSRTGGSCSIERHVFIEQEKCILDDIEEPRNVFKGDTEKVQVTLKIAVSSFFSLFLKEVNLQSYGDFL